MSYLKKNQGIGLFQSVYTSMADTLFQLISPCTLKSSVYSNINSVDLERARK